MTKTNEGVAIVNGCLTLISEARIPLTDRGFLFGHSVFETLLVSSGTMIAWDKHFSRLKQSCERSFINLPDETHIKTLALEAIKQNITNTGIVNPKMTLRVIITGGNSLDISIQKNKEKLPNSNIIILCRNIAGPTKEQYNNGVTLRSCLDFRPKELIDIKSCNYLFNIMALEEAHYNNFDDVLFYNQKGIYTECSSANFIWFDENHNIYSAPFENNCLAGTTLILFIESLSKTNIKFTWKALERDKLSIVAGCAMLSSTRLILPIKKIDENKFSIENQSTFFTDLNKLLEKRINK